MMTAAAHVVAEGLDIGGPAHPLPLLVFVETDDTILENSDSVSWFHVLRDWRWEEYRALGARYYEALYQFNQEAANKREEQAAKSPNPEAKEEARQRELFERPTMGNDQTAVLFEETRPPQPIHIRPEEIAPGRVPARLAGKQPKCFFALFEAFLGVQLMGRAAEPEIVYDELNNNPAFARACGFTPVDPYGHYHQSAVPSLRKLEQFDQIMTASGLWSQCKWETISANIQSGQIKPEPEIVHDTTHYQAFSTFEVVEYKDDKGKTQKKSQSKVTKKCRCEDHEHCPHEWVLGDEGAGTVVKSTKKMYWAHKASVLGLPRQGVPLDAVAVSDAATFDSRTLMPNLRRLFERLPETRDWFEYVLDDGAAYDHPLMEEIEDEFGLVLRASMNPRRRKPLTENLPRGMAKLTPYGELICRAEHTMDYRGVRGDTNCFIYGPPLDEHKQPCCASCPHKSTCCPGAKHGRQATIPFAALPHVRPEDPPMGKRFKFMMKRRPAVERMIKRIKLDLGDPLLSKRGNASFQARLDKSLIALHILLHT